VYAVLTDRGMARLLTAYPTHVRGVREHYIDWLTAAQQDAVSDALGDLAGAFRREAIEACEDAAADPIDA
jgi:hypothetical protein